MADASLCESTPIDLEQAPQDLHISCGEFDEIVAELGRTSDALAVAQDDTERVLAALGRGGDGTRRRGAGGSVTPRWPSSRP